VSKPGPLEGRAHEGYASHRRTVSFPERRVLA
jgi:hypothetical protein